MQNVIKIIEDLKQVSGNAQLDLLMSHKDNELLREVLLYTYDTDKKYHIQEAKLENALDEYRRQVKLSQVIKYQDVTKSVWDSFREYLDELSNKKGVKENEILSFVSKFYDVCKSDELDYLFKGVLLKDLRINMGIKSFQKVWPEIFSKPEVMLAKKFEGKTPNLAYYSRKLDGNRCYWMNGDLYSRTNKKFNREPIQHILDQLQGFSHDFILDGELIYFNPDFKEDFQKTVSLVSKETYQSGCEYVSYVLFDMIPKSEFLAKECKTPFIATYFNLTIVFRTSDFGSSYGILNTQCNNIKVVEQVREDKLPELQKMVKDNGYEGIMIRDAEKPYECKRTSALQKIKKMEDAEFKIVGFEIGTGKYSNTLGSIIIELETGEHVGVGSGFSDEDRNYIWNNQNDILDSEALLKVSYFEKTVDKYGNNSLRFPVFKSFRKSNIETMRI